MSISALVLLNSSLGFSSESKAAPHLTFSQVTQSPLPPSSPSEVLSETKPGLPDCDRPPHPQHTGTVRRGDPLACSPGAARTDWQPGGTHELRATAVDSLLWGSSPGSPPRAHSHAAPRSLLSSRPSCGQSPLHLLASFQKPH